MGGQTVRIPWGRAGRDTYLLRLPIEIAPAVDTYMMDHGHSTQVDALLELVQLGLGQSMSQIESQRIRAAIEAETKRIGKKIREALRQLVIDPNHDLFRED